MSDNGRRIAPRFNTKLKVRFRDAGALIAEYTHNISKGGLFVRSSDPFPLDSLVEVILVLPETQEEISATGKVIHVVGEDMATDSQPAGMGFEFVEMSPEHRRRIEDFVALKLKEQKAAATRDRREHPRFEAKIRVRFGSLEALMEEYSHNISHGGIFIKTPNPKKLGERLNIILTHPKTGEDLSLEGEVVRIVDEENSRRTGHPLGMGVLFLGLDDAVRQRIDSFIQAEYIKNEEFEVS